MDRFVCVRLVQANALDLSLFQFDYDLTFAVFFLNADRTIYGRFGSRSERKDATRDISMEGFRQALLAALDLHKRYPANRAALAGKQPRPARFPTPDEFPSLHGKYGPKLDYEGKVVQSCMHCHQVREAERLVFRADRKPVPDEVLYPYPMPDVTGLSLDPKEAALVRSVAPGSAAERSGFRTGDRILTLENQPILSIADIQWILQNAGAPAVLKAQVRRGRGRETLELRLDPDWRRRSDISWRATSWDLRRMCAGGLLLVDATAEERSRAGVSPADLALRVQHVGEYGDHAAAKKAGFKKDDLLVNVAGQARRMSESELFGFLLRNKLPGDKVPVTVLREGARVDLEMPMQ